MQLQQKFLSYLLPLCGVLCVLESGVIYPVTYFTPVINVSSDLEVIPDNWTQKFEPHVGQISKP